MLVIKRIGWLSLGLVLGAMYLIIGAIVGGILLLVSLVTPERTALGFFGLFALVFFPLLYAAVGFIGGIIVAALYNNLVVPLVGGIRIETEPTDYI